MHFIEDKNCINKSNCISFVDEDCEDNFYELVFTGVDEEFHTAEHCVVIYYEKCEMIKVDVYDMIHIVNDFKTKVTMKELLDLIEINLPNVYKELGE